MARLPRLIVAGHAHLLSQSARHGQTLFQDETDRAGLIELIGLIAPSEGVSIHACAVVTDHVSLVVTAHEADGLSRFMQRFTRRHAAAFNRKHDRRGGLWEGRFRSAVIEPGAWVIRAMGHVDAIARAGERSPHSGPTPGADASMTPPSTWITPPAEYWALGNTPFEREVAYRELTASMPPPDEKNQIEAALRGGWALGTAAFAVALNKTTPRPAAPRAKGRPPRTTSVK